MKEEISRTLFGLRSVADFTKFEQQLDDDYPLDFAVKDLVRSWIRRACNDQLKTIEARRFLSADLSAGINGHYPVVFLGSNDWAIKPYLPISEHLEKIRALIGHLVRVSTIFKDKPIIFAIIPEKDYVIEKRILGSNRFENLGPAMQMLQQTTKDNGLKLIFEEPLNLFNPLDDYTYFDTHLPWSCYFIFLEHILKTLGVDWEKIRSQFEVKKVQKLGDLSKKFDGVMPGLMQSKIWMRRDEDLLITSGDNDFASPLGSTRQSILNKVPLLRAKVLVLGDSHASIIGEHRLSYLLASIFEECEFFWNPLGIREDPSSTDADFIFMEISQRFIL